MLPVSSAALRTVFFGASVVVHGAVFAAMGHASATASEPAREVAVSVVEDATSSPAELLEPGDLAKDSPPVSPPTHTHSYPVPPDHDIHPHDPSIVHLPFAAAAAPTATPVAREPAPDVIDAPPSVAPARFTMTIGAGTSGPAALPSAAAPSTTTLAGTDGAPLPESQASSPARLIGTISPSYPPQALMQELEANVVVSVVVTTAGTVADVQIVKAAGFGFDGAVLDAVRKARFVPAQRDGRAVAVQKRFTVTFGLR